MDTPTAMGSPMASPMSACSPKSFKPKDGGEGHDLYIYFVRHAESENNSRDAHDEAADSMLSPRTKKLSHRGTDEWVGEPMSPTAIRNIPNERHPDPGLTQRGHEQSKAVGTLFRHLTNDPLTGPRLRPQRLFVSGFRRALETCEPVAAALGLKPELHLDLHEEGGIFEGARSDPKRNEYPPRHGLNGQQMREFLPNLQGTESVSTQGWWRGGVETAEESAERAQRCVKFFWGLADQQAASLQTPGRQPSAVVCVSHGLFMDRLLKAFMGLPPAAPTVRLMTANCAYWLVVLRQNSSSTVPRHVVIPAANVIDHVPMNIRTGHKMSGFFHCQPSYPLEDEDEGAQQVAKAAV